MKAVVMNQTGDIGVMAYVERPDPVPGAGQVLVQVAIAGVNFMDIGVRQGMAWNEMPNPKILGVEGAGRVTARRGRLSASMYNTRSPRAARSPWSSAHHLTAEFGGSARPSSTAAP